MVKPIGFGFGKSRQTISLQPHRRQSTKIGPRYSMAKPGQSLPDLSGRETAEELIERFNVVYAQDLRTQSRPESKQDSVSTFYESPSDLMESRQCRLIVVRRCLVLCCLALWLMGVVFLRHWYFTYWIWPLNYSVDLSHGGHIDNDEGKSGHNNDVQMYFFLVLILFKTIVCGSFGVISAYCGRNRLLHWYILLAPWAMLAGSIFAMTIIKMYGDVTSSKLRGVMQTRLGRYYRSRENFDRKVWDRLQSYLKCCGIDSKVDWIHSNEHGELKVPQSCCHTPSLPPKHELDPLKIAKCIRDASGELAWDRGCLTGLHQLLTQWSVQTFSYGFVTVILTGLSIVFAHRYYVLQKKVVQLTYKYTLKEYIIRCCCLGFFCQTNLGKLHEHENKAPVLSSAKDVEANNKEMDEVSGDEASIVYKNPIDKTQSEMILKLSSPTEHSASAGTANITKDIWHNPRSDSL